VIQDVVEQMAESGELWTKSANEEKGGEEIEEKPRDAPAIDILLSRTSDEVLGEGFDESLA